MKTYLIWSMSLAVIVGLFAACQNQASNNSVANTDPNVNMAHDTSKVNHDMSNRPGRDMMNMNSDPNAAQQPFDLQFLDSMIHHHNGAIMMAQSVLGKTVRLELKTFAQKIIDDQTKEIGYMRQLREQWYKGKPSAVNMEMPGMVGGMKMMKGEHMREMDEMEPSRFDNHFLTMMIAHHEGAVTMSKEAQEKGEHPEIKKLAGQIIKAQQPEIEQMKKWQAAWDK